MVLWSSQIWAGPPIPPVTLLDEDDMASNSDTAGVTQQSLVTYAGGLVNSSSATPSVCLRDSNAEGAEDTDEYVTCMHGNMTVTTEDGETGDSWRTVWVGGSETTFIYADGSDNTVTHSLVQGYSSQTKTYNADDGSETVGSDITSSFVLLKTDDDDTAETIHIQDGPTGKVSKVIFYLDAITADDSLILDFETDSTCTGCPNAGLETLDEAADSITMLWIGTATTPTWHYYQASDAQ